MQNATEDPLTPMNDLTKMADFDHVTESDFMTPITTENLEEELVNLRETDDEEDVKPQRRLVTPYYASLAKKRASEIDLDYDPSNNSGKTPKDDEVHDQEMDLTPRDGLDHHDVAPSGVTSENHPGDEVEGGLDLGIDPVPEAIPQNDPHSPQTPGEVEFITLVCIFIMSPRHNNNND